MTIFKFNEILEKKKQKLYNFIDHNSNILGRI